MSFINIVELTKMGGKVRMKKTIILVLVILWTVVAVVPHSDAKGLPSNYVVLKAGGFFPVSGDLGDINADAGFNGEIAIGHKISPGFSVEGGIGYFDTKGTVSIPGASVDEEFEIVPLTVSLRGHVPYGRYEPYGFIGLGVYFVDDKISGSIPSLGVSGSDSDKATSLGFHIGIGGNYTLRNNMFLGIETRYFYLETNTFGVDFRLDGFTLTGNIGYRF
jgi:opacity protein-like surface antigen